MTKLECQKMQTDRRWGILVIVYQTKPIFELRRALDQSNQYTTFRRNWVIKVSVHKCIQVDGHPQNPYSKIGQELEQINLYMNWKQLGDKSQRVSKKEEGQREGQTSNNKKKLRQNTFAVGPCYFDFHLYSKLRVIFISSFVPIYVLSLNARNLRKNENVTYPKSVSSLLRSHDFHEK